MALGTGVHNLSLVVRAHNRASRGLNSVSRDLNSMDKARQAAQAGFMQMSSVGVLAIQALAVASGVLLAGSVMAYARFADAMAGSLAIVDDVSQFTRDKLEATARQISKTTIHSAKDAADAYFHLFSAGQTVEQSMESLPVVANFAQAGLFDLETATELLVTAQNALGLAFDDPIKNMEGMRRVADVLAAADENAVGTIENFADALTNRAAAAMATYNIEVEEGTAVLAAWATRGLKGATAGEAFAIVTRDLQKAAKDNAGAWRAVDAAVYDSSGNMLNLADIVGGLEQAMDGLSDKQKKTLLEDLGFQERSQQRLLQIIGTSDAIREFEATFRKAGGTVDKVAEKQLNSPIKQLVLLRNAVVDLFIGSGKEFNDGFVTVIKGVRNWVNDIGPPIFDFAAKLNRTFTKFGEDFRLFFGFMDRLQDAKHIKIGEALGTDLIKLSKKFRPLVFWVDRFNEGMKQVPVWVKEAVTEWGKLIPKIILASGLIRILATVLGLALSPAVLLAGAIAGLVIGFQTAYENSELFRESIDKAADWLAEFWEVVKDAWPDIKEKLAVAFGQAAEAIGRAQQKLDDIRGAIVAFWEEDLGPFVERVRDDLTPVWDKLGEKWPAVWETIKESFETTWNAIFPLLEQAYTEVKKFWDNAGGPTVQLVINRINGFSTAFEGILKTVSGVIQALSGLFRGDWKAVWDGAWLAVQGVLFLIIASIELFLVDMVALFNPDMLADVEKFFQDMRDFIEDPLGFAKKFVNDVVNAILADIARLKGAFSLGSLFSQGAAPVIPGTKGGIFPQFAGPPSGFFGSGVTPFSQAGTGAPSVIDRSTKITFQKGAVQSNADPTKVAKDIAWQIRNYS